MIGVYHHVHPVTGEEFDYEHVCATCVHYAERTRRKIEIVCCALAPEHDGKTFDQHRQSMLACIKWQRHPTRKPKKKKSKQRMLEPSSVDIE